MAAIRQCIDRLRPMYRYDACDMAACSFDALAAQEKEISSPVASQFSDNPLWNSIQHAFHPPEELRNDFGSYRSPLVFTAECQSLPPKLGQPVAMNC